MRRFPKTWQLATSPTTISRNGKEHSGASRSVRKLTNRPTNIGLVCLGYVGLLFIRKESVMEKDHLAILLEEMNSKFNLVLEGHEMLSNKIDDKFNELNEKIEHNSFLINVVNDKVDSLEVKVDKLEVKVDSLEVKVDGIAADLSAHRADTEAHHGVYLVKEGN
jgi:chaperonin cofactor prefoldin